MKVVILFLVIYVGVRAAYGATFFDEIKIDKVHGKTVKYCEYKNLKLLPVSRIKDYDACVSCKCTRKGLNCVTIGMRVSDPEPNSACVPVVIGCKTRWVMRDNNNKRCPKKLMPKTYSGVGK